jgi:hypothetical protein
MIDKVVSSLIKKTADSVLQPGMNRVPLNYMLGLNIQESIKHFFDQEVETWIMEEDARISNSERFDYDRPEVRMLIDQVFDGIKQSAEFDLPTFHRLLERTIKLEMNFLLKPQQTLTQFIFKDSAIVTTKQVYDTLKYFFRLEYYKDALSEYFNQKYMQEISETQFKELISQIDDKAYNAVGASFALQNLKAILDFINESLDEPTPELPINIIVTALNDRHMSDYADAVLRAESQGSESLNLDELDNLFSTGKTPQELEEEKEAEIQAEEITVTMDIGSIEEEKPLVEVADIDVSNVVHPEPEVEEEEDDDFEEEFEEEDEEVPAKAAKESAGSQLASVMARNITSDQPLEDLYAMIDRSDYKKFVKRLFKKDEPSFKEFLDELNSYDSWQDASVAIDDEFYNRGINPYAKEAISFSDICYKRFFPKDRNQAAE